MRACEEMGSVSGFSAAGGLRRLRRQPPEDTGYPFLLCSAWHFVDVDCVLLVYAMRVQRMCIQWESGPPSSSC